MTAKRKFSILEIKEAIQESGGNITLIAERLGVSRKTVYRYLDIPEIQQVLKAKQETSPVEKRPQFSHGAFTRAIKGSRGIKATVMARMGCSRTTVDTYLRQYPDLNDLLEAERGRLVRKATSALAADVGDPKSKGHQNAYMFVLKTLGKDEGFVERQEVTGKDGQVLFDDKMLALLRELRRDPDEVVREFMRVLEMQKAKMEAGQ